MRKNLDPQGRTVQHGHPFIFPVEGAAVEGAAEITADKAVCAGIPKWTRKSSLGAAGRAKDSTGP